MNAPRPSARRVARRARAPQALVVSCVLAFPFALFAQAPPEPSPQPPVSEPAEPAELAPPAVESEDLVDAGETPSTSANETPVSGEEEAARAYSEGDLPRAVAIYRQLAAAQQEPSERTRLRVTAAWLLFDLGNRSEAGSELAQALYDQPGYAARGDLYSADFLALFEDARADASRRRAADTERLLREGIAKGRAGDRAAARQSLEASLALDPLSPRALAAIAALDQAEGHDDEALAGFQKVLAFRRSAPDRVPKELEGNALNNIGVLFYARSQYEDALEALERAVVLTPRDPRSWFNLALTRRALDRKVEGMRALEHARELDKNDPEIALHLGRAYREAGSNIEAVALLLDAGAAHPQDAALALELALAQGGLGNRAGMFASLSRAGELDPGNRAGVALPAAVKRAEEAIADRDFGSAGRAAEQATALAPGDASSWALLGLARRGEGRLDDAARALEKAAELAPGRADIAHNLGTVYLSQKQLPKAESAFRRALAIDPTFAESSTALARLASASAAAASAPNAKRPPVAKPAPREIGAQLRAVDYQPLGIRGLLVEQVTPGGLAERAGLLVDDLILRADGKPLSQVPTLTALVRSSKAPTIGLSLLRSGRPVELQLRF